jgi:hypothetical protein
MAVAKSVFIGLVAILGTGALALGVSGSLGLSASGPLPPVKVAEIALRPFPTPRATVAPVASADGGTEARPVAAADAGTPAVPAPAPADAGLAKPPSPPQPAAKPIPSTPAPSGSPSNEGELDPVNRVASLAPPASNFATSDARTSFRIRGLSREELRVLPGVTESSLRVANASGPGMQQNDIILRPCGGSPAQLREVLSAIQKGASGTRSNPACLEVLRTSVGVNSFVTTQVILGG